MADQNGAGRNGTTRRAVLGGAAAVAAAGLSGGAAALAGGAAAADVDPLPIPGRIANPKHLNQRVYSGLFFGGPPKPFTRDNLYTRSPLDADRLDWSDEGDIAFAVAQVTKPGLNVIKLSYWGHEGGPQETDESAPALLFSKNRWPGEAGPPTYTEAEQIAKARQLFQAAEKANLLVTPMIEVSVLSNPFFAYFPDDLTQLVKRAGWLLRNFGDSPAFLRMFDRTGRPRRVISLIETIHGSPIDPVRFAAGFDRASDLLQAELGYPVGFTIDPSPNPPYGVHHGPEPAAIRQTRSVVAVNPFNITSQGPFDTEPERPETDKERLRYARNILTKWVSSGVPLIANMIPGYDAHIVFRDVPHLEIYGYSPEWLAAQRDLAVEFGTGGVSVDYWNGYSEGSAIPPTEEDGDRHLRWLAETVKLHRARWT
ncbi:hypothetical protein [Virgisporangium aurantiacum]|uniref:Uncharacterized protein n=1 Tax=Virgisporangium aurantiacum TaxID=175570 RepID=A0A8J3Z2D0_9ACTN|nr:hypothetical protein [Virgisporangium aurantiacum]GIJ56009.1 hypothetical protein Vau01_035250 [Virgisporangium aurantiacum]